MNADDLSSSLVNGLYYTLATKPEDVEALYVEGAPMTINFEGQDEVTVTSGYADKLIKGNHFIMRCDGIQLGEEITAHASGFIGIGGKYYQSNEMFVFAVNPIEHPIIYQSSTYTPVADPNWKPVEVVQPKKEEPKKEEPPKKKEAVQVEGDKIIYTRAVLVTNIPPKEEKIVLTRYQDFGVISRYAIGRNQMLIEYENPADVARAIERGSFKWSNRQIKVKGMPQGYKI